KRVRPAQATLVPDPPDVLTSNAGWDTITHQARLKDIVAELHEYGTRVSIFIHPEHQYFEPAKTTGTDRVALYTEPYAALFHKDKGAAVKPCVEVAALAKSLGSRMNAGHDLDLHNLTYLIESIPYIDAVASAHALGCCALYSGGENTGQMSRRQLEV